MNARSFLVAVLLFAAVSMAGRAQLRSVAVAVPPAQTETAARIVASAQALLSALDEAGRAKVQFAFDGPQKTRWSNLPSGIFERRGLRLGDLTLAQRAAAMAVLSTALSRDGYRKVTDIMRGDEVLRVTEGRGPRGELPGLGGGGPRGRGGRGPGGGRGLIFGQDEYYLAFVGQPSATAPWMLQFGGHHLAINLTMAGGEASMTPSLPAAQPATYTIEGRTVRPLGNEQDKAFALLSGLDQAQRAQAVLGYRVADLVLGAGQDGRTI